MDTSTCLDDSEEDTLKVALTHSKKSILHRRAQIICRCLALVILVVIAVLQPLILLVLFVLVPVFCLLVRYMYSRLAYPFVVSADANLDPKDQKHKWRHPVNLVFWLIIVLSFGGALGARPLGHNSDKVSIFLLARALKFKLVTHSLTHQVNVFLLMFYNSFGALIFPVTSCWFIDTCEVAYFYYYFKQIVPYPALGGIAWQRRKGYLTLALTLFKLVNSYVVAYSDPRLITVNIPIVDLDPCLRGFKIGMVSDLHLGPLSSSYDTQLSLDLLGVSEGNVDALMLVGDIGDQPITDSLVEKFAPYKDVAEGGMTNKVFWTSGNHENIVGVQPYRDLMAESGIVSLENNYTHVTSEGCGSNVGVDFIGVADYTGYTRMTGGGEGDVNQIIKPDIEYAASRIPAQNVENGNPLILLSHQPREWEKADAVGVNLMVSGHTHGGQAFPMHAFIINQEGNAGLFQPDKAKDRYFYVGEGMVGWGPRVRFLSWPEVTIFVLVDAENEEPDTGIRAAQATMYVAIVFFPASLVACCCIAFMTRRIRGREKKRKVEMMQKETEMHVQVKTTAGGEHEL
ncbi:hypothetical protein TrST_g1604 [Triparma strigata]|uniref:Calcineurin-like phosphoesterase domain-containing protein n=1 Tax=Triparma strigata TaxID=1606541 RepID=A0A9W7A0I3_9STRA|nr:hypothetical protein TrST_g1604 [Triparma strigata]